MGFYSKLEKYLSTLCSKNKLTLSIAGLASAFFAGMMLVVSIYPTKSGALIGGGLGIVGAFVYCFFYLD